MDLSNEIVTFPKNALNFYIELYCKKKTIKIYPGERLSSSAKRKRLVADAKKSWHILSQLEKQQIVSKYKLYKAKIKEQISNNLKEAEPFMKKKTAHRETCQINEPEKGNDEVIQESEESHYQQQEEQITVPNENAALYNPSSPVKEMHIDEPQQHTNLESDKDSESGVSVKTQKIDEILTEPVPPHVSTGHELFNMYKSKTGSQENWSDLSVIVRRRYGRVISILKKDYIAKYKQYLESLSPRELFDHYNKTALQF